MYIPQELQIRIIKKATLQELLDVTTYKKNKKKLMFSLLVNSHCCCCGKIISIFNRDYGSYTQRFYSPDWLDDISENKNPYYEGRFCSKYCINQLIDYNEENGEYPPYHQIYSGSQGEGFFEMLNEKYKSVWNKDTDLDYKVNIIY